MTISHGIPKPTDFFLIAQPYTGAPMSEKVSLGTNEDPYKVATLKDPRAETEHWVEIHSMWRFKIEDDEILIDSWAKLTYGLTGKKLVAYMRQQYKMPELNQVEFLLCKKL